MYNKMIYLSRLASGKMTYKLLLTVLLVSMGNWHQALAQSLDDYLRNAAEQHQSLKAAYSTWTASLAKIPQAAALPDPGVSVGFFVLPVETRLGPQRLKVSISQQFPWFGTLKKRKDVASRQAAVAYAVFEDEKNTLFFEVKKAYFEIYSLQQEATLLAEEQSIRKTLERVTLQKYENGNANLSEVLEIQMKIRETATRIDNLNALTASKKSMLAERAGFPVNQEILVIDTLIIEPILYTLTALIDSAKVNNPKAYLLQQKVNVGASAYQLALTESKPKINAGLDYGLLGQRTDANPEGNGRDILMPMIGITLPIFNKNKYSGIRQEAQLQMQSSEQKLAAFLRMVERDIIMAHTAFQNDLRSLELIEKQQETLAQINALTTERYSNTTADYTELLKIKIAQLAFKIEKQKLAATLSEKKALIQKLTGMDEI